MMTEKETKQLIQEIIMYFDRRFRDEEHTQSQWHLPNNTFITTDVGYAQEWWEECGKKELLSFVNGGRFE